MKRLFILAVMNLIILTACASSTPAAYSQATAYTPIRPPAVRPVVNDPYFPAPGATPAGAGLYRPEGAAPVERSPNRRVLPVSDEHGLWAADGDPMLMSGSSVPSIAGVPIVLPIDRLGRQPAPAGCVGTVNAMLTDAQKLVLAGLTESQRRCTVARLYHQCVVKSDAEAREIANHHALMMYRAKHTRQKPVPLKGPSEDERNSKALVDAWCTGGVGAGSDIIDDHAARLSYDIARSK